jgi:outer membrane protein TolC
MRLISNCARISARDSFTIMILVVAAALVTAGARGQTSAVDPPASKPKKPIPPPRRYDIDDTGVRPSLLSGQQKADRAQAETSSSSFPAITPLPAAAVVPDSAAQHSDSRSTPAPPPRLPVDSELIPGRVVEPIDLANALRLAGARDIDINVARQQIFAAAADLTAARALWLPSLFYGPSWYRSDGQIQTVTGQVQNISRSALFLGATAALPNTIQGPPPGTGIPSVNGMTATVRISDAIFIPVAARRVLTADQAAVRTATNDALLQVAVAYFDLQNATGRLAIAREAIANAEALAAITASYSKIGLGLEADHRRASTEVKHRRRDAQLASGQVLVASANLIRLLVLDPKVVVVPVEPPECIVHLIPDDIPLDDLVIQGLRFRPELATAQALVQAAIARHKQARLRPFTPAVFATYGGGGLGGGANSFFGNFGPRGDAEIGLYWELTNLGFTDFALMRRRKAELEISNLEQTRALAQVGADVAAAFETRLAAARQIEDARETLVEAIESLRLNFIDIRQGAQLPRATRPIEVLQPIQALAQGRLDYLDSVLSYNRSQFQLKRAIGQLPTLEPGH